MQNILSFFFCLNYALSVNTAAGNTDFQPKAFLVPLSLLQGILCFLIWKCYVIHFGCLVDEFSKHI